MMKKYLGLLSVAFFFYSCVEQPLSESVLADKALESAEKQLSLLRDEAVARKGLPRTVEGGKICWTDEINYIDWTEGFFPGTCWYMFEYTKDNRWESAAGLLQALCEKDKYLTSAHDLGFMFNSSYGNGFRLTGNADYKEVLLTAAHSLSQRFNPVVGCIQSWDVNNDSWQSYKGWQYPVIIDNMMNLELLFEASKLSGDSTYYNIAVKHADTTMKNHFRDDNSCYHVVDYDPVTGEVRKRQTAQGYADESAWARGQAWAIYGYTMCYRYTHDQKYLDMAEKIYNFIFNNPNLPEDLVPYWDFDAPNIPNEPRDASAAACTASALYELSTYIPGKNYKETADKIMESLGSPAYRAEVGTNGNFILMHSVGSIPHGAEIDVPLNYADYYFLEGIMRKRDLEK